MKTRGCFILFEGLDRSGKSTQAKLLYDVLCDKYRLKTELWKYPNRDTSTGKQINDYLTKKIELDDREIHKLFSQNRWESLKLMKDKLEDGVNLVIDRYAYSGVAYSAAKPNMDFEWCKQCDSGLPKPDLIFFMDSNLNTIKSRENFGMERYETYEFQKKVYMNFKRLFNSEKENASKLISIDATQSIDDIHKNIITESLKCIEKCKNKELEYLW